MKAFVSIVIVMLTALLIAGHCLFGVWLSEAGPEWVKWTAQSGEPMLHAGIAFALLATSVATIICSIILLCEVNGEKP